MSERQSPHFLLLPSEATPDMTEIIDAWLTLPEPLKVGILAMVRANVKGKRG